MTFVAIGALRVKALTGHILHKQNLFFREKANSMSFFIICANMFMAGQISETLNKRVSKPAGIGQASRLKNFLHAQLN